jgi:hypothetical protein
MTLTVVILKSVGLAATMRTALVARGVPDMTAALAGEFGVLAFKRGYAEWSEGRPQRYRRACAIRARGARRAAGGSASLG